MKRTLRRISEAEIRELTTPLSTVSRKIPINRSRSSDALARTNYFRWYNVIVETALRYEGLLYSRRPCTSRMAIRSLKFSVTMRKHSSLARNVSSATRGRAFRIGVSCSWVHAVFASADSAGPLDAITVMAANAIAAPFLGLIERLVGLVNE